MRIPKIKLRSSILLGAYLFFPIAHAHQIAKAEFTIELPAQWSEIPKSAILKAASEVKAKALKANYEPAAYGFQLGNAWLTYPYVMIDIVKGNPLTKAQLASFAKIDISSVSNKVKTNVRGAVASFEIGKIYYDERANILWMMVAISNNTGDTANCLIGTIPTNRGLIRVTGVASTKDWGKHMPILKNIILSIKAFD